MKSEYRTVQISKESRTLLKEYCDYWGFKMGKCLDKLIASNCTVPSKPTRNILRVETKKGS